MANILYIGDEVTAAGYRLAGVETLVPDPADGISVLQPAATGAAELILLSSTLASGLPPAELVQALARGTPLLAIVPDVFGRATPPDLAHEVRSALGIEP
jgi:vacuolar-type H+-ATPase subunit F/Vma7